MQDFRNLEVWQKAHQLTLNVYRDSTQFPRSEDFGLTAQMRRSAVSIASNLAEGCGRRSDAEMNRYAGISMGSASELEYQLVLASDVGYLTSQRALELAKEVVEVKRMLSGLIGRVGRTRTRAALPPAEG